MRRGWMAAVAVAACVAGGATLAHGAPKAAAPTETGWLQAFGEALDRAQRVHIEPVLTDKAIAGAIEGMMKSLDPQSAYLPPEAFDRLMRDADPAEAGAGLSIVLDNGLLLIEAVANDGPAYQAGVQAGEYIAMVGGRSMIGATVADAEAGLQGEAGKAVPVILLAPDGQRRTVSIVLAPVTRSPQLVRMEGDYGYVRPEGLRERATEELIQAITELRRRHPGLKGLVLDLRNNPGGLLDQVVGVADVFLDGGQVMTQRGREKSDINRYHARAGDLLDGLPLVVLIDGATGSGAELVAATLQDRKRARVVGMTSAGSGAIQQVIPLAGGRYGALKITVARLERLDGRPIAGLGVTPDVLVARSATEAARPPRRNRPAPPSLPETPPEGFRGDYQLERALTLLRSGR